MHQLSLFYARKDVGGGSTSFTAHLVRAMQLAGIPHRLYRFTDRPRKPRTLAGYAGINCTYVTPEEARDIVQHTPSVLLAPEHSKNLPEDGLLADLMKRGMRVVVHDPNEFMNSRNTPTGVYDHLADKAAVKRSICIRPAMKQQFFKDAVFIPHPYVREFSYIEADPCKNRKSACSIARLTFVKRPEIILDANRMLPKTLRIQFHGLENRLFTYFKVLPKYKEFKQGGYSMPLEWGISARKAAEYTLAVDMTYFPHDGGGSQYTFMEAWDAGTVNVIHRDWLRYKGEMQEDVNCIVVNGAEDLADVVIASQTNKKFKAKLRSIAHYSFRHLGNHHDPVRIAKLYYKELTK